ncbi:MAG: insulinase family protein, partial [Lachnospiraceae bacterium]|nr:insulinase family protein [Lachnospiraceae bacterium]
TQTQSGMELVKEIMLTSRIDDEKRLFQIIAEQRSRLAGYMMYAGHTVASAHALSYLTDFSARKENIGGMGFFRFLEEAEENFESRKDEIIAKLKKVRDLIFRKDNLFLDITGSRKEFDSLKGTVKDIVSSLSDKPADIVKEERKLEVLNEGFTNSAQVQYVCRAGNYAAHGLSFDPVLYILKTILGYEYLWNEVRVKGGAYGCMSRFTTYGEASFVSYRDPNLDKTMEIFEGISDFVKNFKADEKKMTRYIIGTMSDVDIPLTPRLKGARSLQLWLDQDDDVSRQARRERLLSANDADIRSLYRFIDAIMEDNALCVVGNEGRIKESAGMFKEIKPLFNR